MSALKVIAVDFTDGTTWAFPASLVVDHRRAFYESIGRVVDDPHEDSIIEDWASSNMDWDDVKAAAEKIARKTDTLDYGRDWSNAPKRVVDVEVKP